MPTRRFHRRLLLAVWFVALLPFARGVVYVYTFETVDISVPPVTPLLSYFPDVNPDTFTTTFTSPLADGYAIDQFNGPTLISGHNLIFNPTYFNGTAPSDLTLTFNQAVQSVSLTISAPSGISAVTATTSQGDFQLLASPSVMDAGIPTYYVNLAPVTQFTSLTLSFTYSNQPLTFYAIDDITISAAPPFMPIPEPSTFASLVCGLGLLAGSLGLKRWRKRQASARAHPLVLTKQRR